MNPARSPFHPAFGHGGRPRAPPRALLHRKGTTAARYYKISRTRSYRLLRPTPRHLPPLPLGASSSRLADQAAKKTYEHWLEHIKQNCHELQWTVKEVEMFLLKCRPSLARTLRRAFT